MLGELICHGSTRKHAHTTSLHAHHIHHTGLNTRRFHHSLSLLPDFLITRIITHNSYNVNRLYKNLLSFF